MLLKPKSTHFLTIATAATLLLLRANAGAQVYTAIILGPTGTDTFAQGFGISASGDTEVGTITNSSGNPQAVLWSGTTTYTNITPTSSTYSGAVATGSSDSDQTGYAILTSNGRYNAGYWNRTATSFVDLNPTGAADSEGLAILNGTEAGYENVGTEASPKYNASIWTETAASFVDLNGSFYSSVADSTYGSGATQKQAGYAKLTSGGVEHAVVWSGGVATSPLDLNSTGSNYDSMAFGINNSDVVGERMSSSGANWRAAYWNISGTPNFTNLNPTIGGTWMSSMATATRGGEAVGYGVNSKGVTEAVIWTGFAASDAVVLPIPTGYTATYATGLDSYGDVIGYGIDSSGMTHAILWATPAPDGLNVAILGAIPGAFLMIRRRKSRLCSSR